MTSVSSFARALSDRPKQLLGVGFTGLGTGHFALWTRSAAEFSTALAAGDAAAAATAFAAYAQHHPAYVLAALCGLVVAAWDR